MSATTAGRRDRRIDIYRGSHERDAATGSPSIAFNPWIKRWARRRTLSTRESFTGQQHVAVAELAYELPDDGQTREITAAPIYRLVDAGRAFDVVGVNPGQRMDKTITLLVRGRTE